MEYNKKIKILNLIIFTLFTYMCLTLVLICERAYFVFCDAEIVHDNILLNLRSFIFCFFDINKNFLSAKFDNAGMLIIYFITFSVLFFYLIINFKSFQNKSIFFIIFLLALLLTSKIFIKCQLPFALIESIVIYIILFIFYNIFKIDIVDCLISTKFLILYKLFLIFSSIIFIIHDIILNFGLFD